MAKDRESRTVAKPSAKRGAGDHLSAEERVLWEHAARDLKPLKTKKSRVHGAQDTAMPRQRTTEAEKKPQGATARKAPQSQAPAKSAMPPPLAALDRRAARQIGSGRVEVEARIDLHGLRQSGAHAVLRRFLMEAHAKGRRWVLVITGKGGPQRRDADADVDGAYEERGVLRRNVPRWLAEPELRAIVVGFTEAAIRHGGEGALYVQLRRRERAGR